MVLETIHNALSLFREWILTLYSPSQLILTFHLLIRQVTTRMLVPSAAFPHFLLVAVTETTLFKGHFPINAARTFVGTFNVEVTVFPWTAPTLYPRASSIVLVLFSGSTLGAAFDGVLFFSSRFWDAEDRIVLGYISRPFGLSLHVLGNTSPRRGPWALMESGPGSQILWPHTYLKIFTLNEIVIDL